MKNKTNRGYGKPGTKEENEKVIEMYENGDTIRKIARELNRSYCFVYTRIENYRLDKFGE